LDKMSEIAGTSEVETTEHGTDGNP
jgi:hypothetical protein